MRGSFRRGAERRPGGGAPASPRAERAGRGNRLPDHHLTYTAIPDTGDQYATWDMPAQRANSTVMERKGKIYIDLVMCRGPGVPTCVIACRARLRGGVPVRDLESIERYTPRPRGSHYPHVAPGTTCTHLERCTRDPDYTIRRGPFEVIMHMRMRSVNTQCSTCST